MELRELSELSEYYIAEMLMKLGLLWIMKNSGLSFIFINKIIKGADKNWAQYENKVPSTSKTGIIKKCQL